MPICTPEEKYILKRKEQIAKTIIAAMYGLTVSADIASKLIAVIKNPEAAKTLNNEKFLDGLKKSLFTTTDVLASLTLSVSAFGVFDELDKYFERLTALGDSKDSLFSATSKILKETLVRVRNDYHKEVSE